MPELAAHLERVAKELARLNGVHLCQTCGHRRGEHAFDLVGEHFCEHDEGVGTDCCKCQDYVGVMRPNYAELVAALESAAAALAACAREAGAKLKPYCRHLNSCAAFPASSEQQIKRDCNCGLAALERAAGEKAKP